MCYVLVDERGNEILSTKVGGARGGEDSQYKSDINEKRTRHRHTTCTYVAVIVSVLHPQSDRHLV